MPGAEVAIEVLVSASVSDLVSVEPFNKVVSFAAVAYKIYPRYYALRPRDFLFQNRLFESCVSRSPLHVPLKWKMETEERKWKDSSNEIENGEETKM
jgi:hypothetical protein